MKKPLVNKILKTAFVFGMGVITGYVLEAAKEVKEEEMLEESDDDYFDQEVAEEYEEEDQQIAESVGCTEEGECFCESNEANAEPSEDTNQNPGETPNCEEEQVSAGSVW